MNFGRSEKVKKTICRSLGRIDKMDFFLGKVKKWKKRSVEAQVLTHYLRLKSWKSKKLSQL